MSAPRIALLLVFISGCAGREIPEFYAHRGDEIPESVVESWRRAQVDVFGLVGTCAFGVDPTDFVWVTQTAMFDCLGERASGCFIPGHTILVMPYVRTVRHEARHAIAFHCGEPTWATIGHEEDR